MKLRNRVLVPVLNLSNERHNPTEDTEKRQNKRATADTSGFNSKKYIKKSLQLSNRKSEENFRDEINSRNVKKTEIVNDPKSKPQVDVFVPKPIVYTILGNGPSLLPTTGKKYVGCHVSAAGGIWNAFDNGAKTNAKSIGLFLRNQRSWNAKPLDKKSIDNWKIAQKEFDFESHLILPHGSYLMNLGNPKEEILEKSRNLFIEELQRCDSLGIPNFNFHPGSSLGAISREECCHRIADSINIGHKASRKVICVIENMSKQGFTIGGDFHEIRLIIENVKDKTRVGVCLDTCHSHAAGYDLSSEKGFETFLSDFETIIGWQFLRGLHLNDSKGKCGDHKDRHEKIGKGTIGLEGFRRIMNCRRFNDMPMILETPYSDDQGYTDEIALLESLIEK